MVEGVAGGIHVGLGVGGLPDHDAAEVGAAEVGADDVLDFGRVEEVAAGGGGRGGGGAAQEADVDLGAGALAAGGFDGGHPLVEGKAGGGGCDFGLGAVVAGVLGYPLAGGAGEGVVELDEDHVELDAFDHVGHVRVWNHTLGGTTDVEGAGRCLLCCIEKCTELLDHGDIILLFTLISVSTSFH